MKIHGEGVLELDEHGTMVDRYILWENRQVLINDEAA
jgi:hypothetical protein